RGGRARPPRGDGDPRRGPPARLAAGPGPPGPRAVPGHPAGCPPRPRPARPRLRLAGGDGRAGGAGRPADHRSRGEPAPAPRRPVEGSRDGDRKPPGRLAVHPGGDEGDRVTAPARSRVAMAVMAKVPAPGEVKTRLCPPLTLGQAATLARCFLQDRVEQ